MKNSVKTWGLALFLAVIAASLLRDIQAQWQKILIWDLVDSDDTMRVLQVRAWFSGQGFYDLFNHRSNPPFGASMHWSRLADLPLAIAQISLRPFFGVNMAESMAVFAVPPILGLGYASLLGYGAKRLSSSKFSPFFAIIFFIFSVSATYNFMPGRVDHHGLQLICLVVMIIGLINNCNKGGIIAGLGLGSSLTIGFEMLPLQVLAVAWLAIIWGVEGASRKRQVVGFSTSFAIAIIIGFAFNVAPNAYFTANNDALSIAQVAPILLGALTFGLAAKYGSSHKPYFRLLYLGIIAAFVLICALQFDELFKPIYWQTSEILRTNWLLKNGEVIPMLERPILDQMAVGLLSILALFAAFSHLFTNRKSPEVANWILLTILLIAAAGMAFFYQTRFHFQATTIAILILAAVLPKYLSEKSSIFALMVLAFAAPFAQTNLKQTANKNIGHNTSEYAFNGVKKCRTTRDFAALAAQPKGLLTTNLDLGALALITTPHEVLGTAYHRDFGKEYMYQILISAPEVAHTHIRAHNVDYLAYCASDVDIDQIAKLAPNGLMARLIGGQVPGYLQPIAPKSYTEVVAFKVKN
jgi:hypothetical protein